MKHLFACLFCRTKFPHSPGVGLYCSPRCEEADARLHKSIGQKLETLGFKRHAKAPNLYLKDGTGITTHEVKTHGFKETLAKHKAAVDSKA